MHNLVKGEIVLEGIASRDTRRTDPTVIKVWLPKRRQGST